MQDEKNTTESRRFSPHNMFLYSNCGTLLIFFSLSLLVFPYCVWPRGSFSTELADTGERDRRSLAEASFLKYFPSASHRFCQQRFGVNRTSKLQKGLDNAPPDHPRLEIQPSADSSSKLLQIFLSQHMLQIFLTPSPTFFRGFKPCGCIKLISGVRCCF